METSPVLRQHRPQGRGPRRAAARGQEGPYLTILFGSRAKGDYAWGRSDVDIMLVEDSPPEDEAAEASRLIFRREKA